MIKFVEEKDNFGEVSIRGDKEWIQFDAGYDDVCLDGTFTIDDLRQIIGEMERHLTKRALDVAYECPKCGATLEKDGWCAQHGLPAQPRQ